MRPRVSVIIPNFNRANLIAETLKNILQQSRPPHELIVVDDGSTDESITVIKGFGNRVKLLRQSNRGPAAARNYGLEHATGEFIQFFDSDDLCTFNKLQAQAEALESSGADFAYGPWLKTELAGRRATHAELPLQQGPLPDTRSALSWFLRGWVIVFQACMFRRSFIDCVGRYRSDLMIAEDSEFLFRMLKAGGRGVHVPDALVLYRVHQAGQITFGGMNAIRRQRDWLCYTEIVAGQLATDDVAVGRLDALRWGATVWAARRDFDFLEEAVTVDYIRYGLVEKALFRFLNETKRIRAGLRSRFASTRLPPCYRVAPLTKAQEQWIREIGYEPVKAEQIAAWAGS